MARDGIYPDIGSDIIRGMVGSVGMHVGLGVAVGVAGTVFGRAVVRSLAPPLFWNKPPTALHTYQNFIKQYGNNLTSETRALIQQHIEIPVSPPPDLSAYKEFLKRYGNDLSPETRALMKQSIENDQPQPPTQQPRPQ